MKKWEGRNHSPRALLLSGRAVRENGAPCQTDTSKSVILAPEMSRTITITYNLKPPADTPQSSLTPSKTHAFAVKDEGGHYVGLRAAIATTKDTIGKELTEWRDQVGDLEKGKDVKPKKTQADADADDEDEEEGR